MSEMINLIKEQQIENYTDYESGEFIPGSYSVCPRDNNYLHFDIFALRRPGYVKWHHINHPNDINENLSDNERERAFAIRGREGETYIRDERWDPERPFPRESIKFVDAEEAMQWAIKTLVGV